MSFELMTSHVVVDLILHNHWYPTTTGSLILHLRAMPDESEPEMCAHISVVQSSNPPDHTTLHAHL